MRDLRQGHMRQDQDMHMVGHDRPSLQLIHLLLALTGAEYLDYPPRNPRVAHPPAAVGLGQCAIPCSKRMAWSCIDDVGLRGGQSTVQAPGNEEVGVIGML